MESGYFLSSSPVRSAKRGLAEELLSSPAAKRAKRVRKNKKRQAKRPINDGNSAGVEQQGGVSSQVSSATGTPFLRNPARFHLFPQFPPKRAPGAHVPGPVKRAKHEPMITDKNGAHQNGQIVTSATRNNYKAEANTRKARADPDTTSSPRISVTSHQPAVRAVAGPSQSKAEQKKPAWDATELTPMSQLATVDYTFKAFPNPSPAQFSNKESSTNISKTAEEPVATTPRRTHPERDSSPLPTKKSLTAPAGTKTLKAINRHLKVLESKLSAMSPSQPDSPTQSNRQGATTSKLDLLLNDTAQLRERLDLAEQRAAVRHEVLFNALVKVSTDLHALTSVVQQQQQQQQQRLDGHGQDSGTPGADAAAMDVDGDNKDDSRSAAAAAREKHARAMQLSRKTYEQCLRSYVEDMERAGSKEDVAKLGRLCVRYAGDLFKTLG